MKIKSIIAACAALCSVSAFAGSCPATVTTAEDLVNKCAPEVAFYFGGASAQEPAVLAIMNAGGNGIFDTTKPLVRLTSTAGGSDASHGASQSTAWVGFGKAVADGGDASYAGKRIIAIYNKVSGSGGGHLQLLNGAGAAKLAGLTNATQTIRTLSAKEEAKSIPFTSCGTTFAADAVATDAVTHTGVCTNSESFFSGWSGAKIMHMSLLDVEPQKLDPSLGIKKDGGARTATAYQGFGLIVSPSLYAAMQAKGIADGKIDAACTTASTDVKCQPSMSSADYAGLLSGTVKSAKAFLKSDADDAITVARRVVYSGTQAASNIFFLNQAGYNKKTELSSFLAPLGAKAASGTDFVTIVEGNTTGDVRNAVRNATGYAVGVVSLENLPTSSSVLPAKYVKIDGHSPDVNAAGVIGTAAAKNRISLQNGYPFQFQMTAVVHSKAVGTAQEKIATNIINALKLASNSDIAGLAYTDVTGITDAAVISAKQATYERALNNNYAPLRKK